MAKKKKKQLLYLFPLLFLSFPFLIFLVISTIKFIKTGTFNYVTNFTYFYQALKGYSEYIIPTILFFTFALTYIVIIKLCKKTTKKLSWILIELFGITFILCGSRFIFVLSNNLWNNDILSFIFNGINIYTFIFSSELCFFTSSILFYFDKKYLKK